MCLRLALFVFLGGCLCVPIPLFCVLVVCVNIPSRVCMLISLMGPQQHLYKGKVHTSNYHIQLHSLVVHLRAVASASWGSSRCLGNQTTGLTCRTLKTPGCVYVLVFSTLTQASLSNQVVQDSIEPTATMCFNIRLYVTSFIARSVAHVHVRHMLARPVPHLHVFTNSSAITSSNRKISPSASQHVHVHRALRNKAHTQTHGFQAKTHQEQTNWTHTEARHQTSHQPLLQGKFRAGLMPSSGCPCRHLPGNPMDNFKPWI